MATRSAVLENNTSSLEKDLGIEADGNNSALESVFKKTCAAMENSKGQIFEIYESTKREVEESRRNLEELKEITRQLQDEVDNLAAQENREKLKLVRVSSNFANYSEDKIRESYETVKDVQVRLGVAKEKEYQARKQRDRLELQLRNMERTLVAAEHLATKLGTVMTYMTSQLSDMVTKMEIASKNKFLGVQIIKAQEDERLRVSREIHDGPAQQMANLIYQASICERLVDIKPDEAKHGMQELRRQIRSCLTDVRQIIFDMRPMSLDDLGLVPAVRQLINKLDERNLLKTDFQVDGKSHPLDKHVEVCLFRMIQEALNNVYRHSGVTNAKVRMLFAPDHLAMVIADEGEGFDMAAMEEERKNSEGNGHFGILGMEERASIIGAILTVLSEPGKGTKVHIKMPYPDVQKK